MIIRVVAMMTAMAGAMVIPAPFNQ